MPQSKTIDMHKAPRERNTHIWPIRFGRRTSKAESGYDRKMQQLQI